MKTIKMTLDPDSIQRAIAELEKYRNNELQRKIEKTMLDIIQRLEDTARAEYATSQVNLRHERIGKTSWVVIAETPGEPWVMFLEFGTGQLVNEGHDYAKKVEIDVWPGSWSDKPELGGKGTYQMWHQSGGSAYAVGVPPAKSGPYRYNHKSRPGMLRGVEAARKYIRSMAARAR